MQIYKEWANVRGEYIDLNYLLSHSWARIFVVIGGRGYGKTYFFKRKFAKDFIYDKKKMVLIRDTVEACDKVVEYKGIKFWGDLFSIDKVLSKHNASIEGYEIKIDNKHAGDVIPLSAYYKYKGNFYDADNILFDEFIEEKVQAYRGNRARQFVNTIETIVRRRPNANVYLTGNALDLGNDILELLGISIKQNKFGYYLNKDKGVIVYYAPDSKEFRQAKQNSLAGKMAMGTMFEANLNNNAFDDIDLMLFEKREKCQIYGIYYNLENESIRLYKATNNDIYYVCKDINTKTYDYMRYVFSTSQMQNNRKFGTPELRKWLEYLLLNKKVRFQSKYVFDIYCSIINKTIKK